MNIQRPAFIAALALAALTVSCAPHARVGVYADVPGPPSLAFETQPYLVPLPGTYAYAAPDYDVDLYYADGYYWRPWQGGWYRSASYDRGWVAFSGVPGFYTSLPRDWRNDYRSHRWRGHSWDYARVPHHEVERNWSTWKRERRWDDDQRRYTGDRRWHDDGGRQTDDRNRDGRNDDRRGSNQGDYDRRTTDGREQSRPDYDRREPDRREVDRRVYENREVERRAPDGRQPVERREIQQRSVDVERRSVEPRQVERRDAAPGARELQPRPVVQERRTIERQQVDGDGRGQGMKPRPVVQERRTIERQQVDGDGRGQRTEPRPVVQERRTIERQPVNGDGRGQGEGQDVTPRGRGPVGKDENRDGIDDRMQRLQ